MPLKNAIRKWAIRLYRGEAPQPPRAWVFDDNYRDPVMRADTAAALNHVIDTQRSNIFHLRRSIGERDRTIEALRGRVEKLEWLLYGRLDGPEFERLMND